MSQPKKYKAEVVSITNPVENIFTVEFSSMTGRFRYLPGQFMHLALDEYDPSFGWPESRCFSMQSSPNDDLLKITFIVKGRFTSRMAKELFKGKVLDVKLPFGELFQQDHSIENVVFIAGGTGITPFLSIFNDLSFVEYRNPTLYFGLREKRYNLYETELNRAIQVNKEFRINTLYQDSQGILDIKCILKENSIDSTYFISGPQIMITSFKTWLLKSEIIPNQIKTDDWA